jgi:2-polyprenyl-6-hydroxyphenyl methylase/3-demethylubiquinone-9 3-methyltransferase
VSLSDAHRKEIEAGERFAFGKNWAAFLSVLDEPRIASATQALADMLGRQSLAGLRFLDIGSGSGLMSLAAWRLGANVTSFDYDPDSVGCTLELRKRFAQGDTSRWRVEPGSALDPAYLESLGTFDIVYSWGVLHHTGSMWPAVELASRRVAPGGLFFIALYNDQGAWSPRWRRIKEVYCSGTPGRWLVSSTFIPWWVLRNLAADIVWMRNPMTRYSTYGGNRGMSVYYDWHDWLGGLPFEFAKPEAVLNFLRPKGFELTGLTTCGGSVGCNEFVFKRVQG